MYGYPSAYRYGDGNGYLTSGTAPVPDRLLDTLGIAATVAVGLRLLTNDYAGDCLRVRRAADDVEQDIGFDGDGVIDWADAISFKGGSSLTVVKWYDQSSNSNDLDAFATDSREPVLDTSGQLIDFDGSDDFLWKQGVDLSATDKVTMLFAGGYSSLTGTLFSIHTGGTNFAYLNTDGTYVIGQQNDGAGINGLYDTGNTSNHVFSMVMDRALAAAAETKAYADGTILANVYVATELSANFGNSNYIEVSGAAGSLVADMKALEFIVFPSALSGGDRGTAEADIAAFYGI